MLNTSMATCFAVADGGSGSSSSSSKQKSSAKDTMSYLKSTGKIINAAKLSTTAEMPWENIHDGYSDGSRHDNMPVDTVYEGQEDLARFGVYMNTAGHYEMLDREKSAAEDTGLACDQIQGGVRDAYEACVGVSPAPDAQTQEIYYGMSMYTRAHDTAYLSSLDSEGLTEFMGQYLEWEKDHVQFSYDEEGKKVESFVSYGCTMEEYNGMSKADRDAYDANMGNCSMEWAKNYKEAFSQYVMEPDVQKPNEPVVQGSFWDNLKSKAADVMAGVKAALSGSAIGAWVVGAYDKVVDMAKGLVDKVAGKGEEKYKESDFEGLPKEDDPMVQYDDEYQG